MGTYHPLTEPQRYQIYALRKAGHDQQGIAATLGVSPSTIGRELRRNRGQRIYQHIRADRQAGGTLYRHLRHGQKKRKKRDGKADGRGQIKDRVSIEQRPALVEEKSRIGDWEIGLVLGRPGTGALVSLVERRSRYTVLGKVASKQAEPVAAATIALLTPHKEHTQTITADNGKEFADDSTELAEVHATIS